MRTTTEDARRIQDFLDGFDAQTYDLYGDLVQRGEEFEGIRTGAAFPLDRHIDQDKLTEFLEQRFMDAMANADPSNQASRDEVAFYQQAHLAAKEGRNPLVDLGDQISYLRGKFDPNVPIDDLPENLQDDRAAGAELPAAPAGTDRAAVRPGVPQVGRRPWATTRTRR